jgi:hypothetical protein
MAENTCWQTTQSYDGRKLQVVSHVSVVQSTISVSHGMQSREGLIVDIEKLKEAVNELIEGAELIQLTDRRIGVVLGKSFEMIDPKTQTTKWRKAGASMEATVPDGVDVTRAYSVITAHAALQAAVIEMMQKEGRI